MVLWYNGLLGLGGLEVFDNRFFGVEDLGRRVYLNCWVFCLGNYFKVNYILGY